MGRAGAGRVVTFVAMRSLLKAMRIIIFPQSCRGGESCLRMSDGMFIHKEISRRSSGPDGLVYRGVVPFRRAGGRL